jgi:hypothetical protein
MSKYFSATDEFRIETSQDMDPERKGTHIMPGLMRAHITVYEPGDDAHPSLPTLRDFLAKHIDPNTGLLTYEMLGSKLTLDPTPLRQLPAEYLDYRLSPGASFVTHEALNRARAEA